MNEFKHKMADVLFNQNIIDYFNSECDYDTISFSSKDSKIFSKWEFSYILPSIIKSECYEFVGKYDGTSTGGQVDCLYNSFIDNICLFKFMDYISELKDVIRMTNKVYNTINTYVKSINGKRELNKYYSCVKVSFDSLNKIESYYFEFPLAYLTDNFYIDFKKIEIVVRGDVFYIHENENLKKYSKNYLCEYLRKNLYKQSVLGINKVLELDLDDSFNDLDAFKSVVDPYIKLIEMMNI